MTEQQIEAMSDNQVLEHLADRNASVEFSRDPDGYMRTTICVPDGVSIRQWGNLGLPGRLRTALAFIETELKEALCQRTDTTDPSHSAQE